MIRVKRYMRRYAKWRRTVLTGPELRRRRSAPGRPCSGSCRDTSTRADRSASSGRSATLGYEAAAQLEALGIGVSTSVDLGGDPINGSSFRDVLERFETDDETEVIALIGELGGPQEAEAAGYVRDRISKPVVAYVAGLTAHGGRVPGHAGAIIIRPSTRPPRRRPRSCRPRAITVARHPSVIGETVAEAVRRRTA